jgi:hypothetical protein
MFLKEILKETPPRSFSVRSFSNRSVLKKQVFKQQSLSGNSPRGLLPRGSHRLTPYSTAFSTSPLRVFVWC